MAADLDSKAIPAKDLDASTVIHKTTTRLYADRAAWLVASGWSDRLFGKDAPNWFALENDHRAQRVKRGHERCVWRVPLGDRLLYAKVSDRWKRAARLKGMALGYTARREWRLSQGAADRGASVVRYPAVGIRHGARPRTVLLSEAIRGAIRLDDCWEQTLSTPASACRRRRLIRLIDAVARLFAEAHEAGFLHGDAHPANILVCDPADGPMEAVFVDLQAGRLLSGAVGIRAALRSLAELDQFFHRRATRTQRLRFLRRYLELRPRLGMVAGRSSSLGSLIQTYGSESRTHADRLARRRDRRIAGNNKYFARLNLGGGWSATVTLTLERRHLFPEPSVPDRRAEEWRRWLECLIHNDGDDMCGVHVWGGVPLRVEPDRIRGWFRRAWRTVSGTCQWKRFVHGHQLRHRDVAGELILVFLQHRRYGLVDATALVMPEIETDGRSPGNGTRP